MRLSPDCQRCSAKHSSSAIPLLLYMPLLSHGIPYGSYLEIHLGVASFISRARTRPSRRHRAHIELLSRSRERSQSRYVESDMRWIALIRMDTVTSCVYGEKSLRHYGVKVQAEMKSRGRR